jgi:hypothetical protein
MKRKGSVHAFPRGHYSTHKKIGLYILYYIYYIIKIIIIPYVRPRAYLRACFRRCFFFLLISINRFGDERT